jgi:hypothetical protein
LLKGIFREDLLMLLPRVREAARTMFLLLFPVGLSIPAFGQSGTENGDWRYYGGDAQSTKYSLLQQIDRNNVCKLQTA